MTLPFKVEYSIVCDHIRREDNGKLILIGVYGGSILVPSLPAAFGLSQFVRVTPTGPGAADVEFRVLFEGTEIAKAEAHLAIGPTQDQALISLGPFPIAVDRAGMLRFEIREKGKRWTRLDEARVGVNPAASSSVTSPPS